MIFALQPMVFALQPIIFADFSKKLKFSIIYFENIFHLIFYQNKNNMFPVNFAVGNTPFDHYVSYKTTLGTLCNMWSAQIENVQNPGGPG